MASSFKIKYKRNIFELSIGLNDLYSVMHIMQRKNIKKLQNTIYIKKIMEMFQKEELAKSKCDKYEVFFGFLL